MSTETHKGLEFTEDWFTTHIPVWIQLMEVLPAHDRFLELGSFEGRSACWLLEHGLSPEGELVCVDTWGDGVPEFVGLPPEHVAGAHDRFTANIASIKGEGQTVRVMTCPTVDALALLYVEWGGTKIGGERYVESFDFIYVDAGHMAYQTLTDMVMAWPVLKVGGIMVMDDYEWSWGAPPPCRPKIAVDAFMACFEGRFEILAVGWQVALRKLA